MIITEIYNGQGLGNQLWCYVTTRVIALDRGFDFGIMHPEKFKCLDFMNLDLGKPVIGGEGPEGGPPTKLPQGIKHYYPERKITHPDNGVDVRTFDPHLLDIYDNTKLDGVMQDERYIAHRKEEIRIWLKVKPEFECFDYADDDTCVINFRGGEYVPNTRVFLPQSYWDNAIEHMRTINPKMRFVVITDDVKTAKKFFPEFEVHHFSISKDYVVIKNAHYLILSNSSFACFPAWLNENLKRCIAPKYWSQYNFSDGYWGCSYNITSGWLYLNRDGKLEDAESCRKQLEEYMHKHPEIFKPKKIKKNFLVISDYNNDLRWIPDMATDYLIYDQSEKSEYPKGIDMNKVVRSKHTGHNLSDYCTFIIDHYDNLPEITILGKGNMFPRHVRREYFESVMNNDYFTPIEDMRMHKPVWPKGFFSSEGGFNEINNSLYLKAPGHPLKYFNNYNDFLKFVFKNPVLPRYVRFPPGSMFVLPKAHILKYPKVFYENLRQIVSYDFFPGEAYILERAFYTIWASSFDVNKHMLSPIDPNMSMIAPPSALDRYKEKIPLSVRKRIPTPVKQLAVTYFPLVKKVARKLSSYKQQQIIAKQYKEERDNKKTWGTPEEIAAYRKTIKIYDVFTLFNELDLLELRMEILDKAVDYFVIVEATETFTGKPKPLYYEENKERFKKWQHKIIHHVTRDVPKNPEELRERVKNTHLSELDKQIINDNLTSDNIAPGAIHWFKEFYQKENIKKALVGINDNDICFVGDVDEIWNPDIVIDYRNDAIFKLRQKVYAYFFNNRSSEPWAGTLVTKYKNIKHACLNHLRTARKTHYIYLSDGGWHFTNMGGADQIRKKLESYGHQEYNNEAIRADIENKIKSNTDFIGRGFTFWTEEKGLPDYIIKNKEKYKHYFK